MITDARVLQPDFVPQDVKHRPAEISHLTDTLRPILSEEGYPETSLLYGPSGAGKTCIARYTLQQLREQVVDLDTQYVNCWEDYNRFRALYRILEGIDQTLDIHRQSTPRDVLLERLRNYGGHHYVVILDEVDQFQDKKLLYDLYRIPNLTMILIANREEDVFSTLDERLNSRLQTCARIRFNYYTLAELITILEDRVRWGLEPDATTHSEIELIANVAAGDARVAIGVLRNATRMARQRGETRITEDIIQNAVPEAKSEIKKRTTDKLTEHQQTLYDIILDQGEVGAGDLYEEYCRQVEDPKTQRTMRNHLSKLEQYNLIVSQGQTRARTYRPYS